MPDIRRTASLNLRPHERRKVETEAAASNEYLSEWVRRVLLTAVSGTRKPRDWDEESREADVG